MEIFCFFIGLLFFYTGHSLLPVLSVGLFIITPRWPVVFMGFSGLLVALLHQEAVKPSGLPETPVIQQAIVTGFIASIPIQSHYKTQFILHLKSINGQSANGLIQLAWYQHAEPVKAGQKWQFIVKLKKPRPYQNPGSERYDRTLSSRHIFWTGYIKGKNNQHLADKSNAYTWLKYRATLHQKLLDKTKDNPTAGILEALTLNTTTQISQEQWNLFRRTGTTHLFGVSGEHIALIFGFCFFVVKWLWSRIPYCCLLFPASAMASMTGFIAAIFYAMLAGFAPPVQRALVGCFFYTVYAIGKQRFTPWQTWRYALFFVLCLEPHAVFMQGFYFSFLAVACLLLTQQRWQLTGIKAKLALQLSCLLGLMPLTLYWYSYGSINGFIANFFAIPLVGLLIMPLALACLIFCTFDWASLLTQVLSWLVKCLYLGLGWVEHLAVFNITWPLTQISFVLALMAALLLWVLLPAKPFKPILLLCALCPLFPERTTIQPQEALINVLDVGQGLSILVRTARHVLLYDTGDRFYQGSDLGKLVILPYLKTQGIKSIDTIVISHPDKDHRGGLESIEKEIPVQTLLVNQPDEYPQGLPCHQQANWAWDGVDFRFFPIPKAFKNRNNTSCVLKITTPQSQILFTGDIEKDAEDYLIKTYGHELASDVLILPHHASKTSSSYPFLKTVAPHYAIASLGFDNRFHFPHAKTIQSLNALHITFYRTDECGMTQIKLPAIGLMKAPHCDAPTQ